MQQLFTFRNRIATWVERGSEFLKKKHQKLLVVLKLLKN